MPETHDEWRALAQRASAGEARAAAELVEAAYPEVFRSARRMLPRDLSAEDVTQDVLLRMLDRLDQFRGAGPFAAWLARLTANACLDALRARRRRPEWRWSDLTPEEAHALAESVAERPSVDPAAARELVDKLLAELPAEDEAVVRLLDLEGLAVREIADRLGKSTSWVKTRAVRARRRLRARFDAWEKRDGH